MARSIVCREVATQLEHLAELFERLELSSWRRHFLRDAELLRMRAERDERDETGTA